jgi:CheY-like chemotaxis protein
MLHKQFVIPSLLTRFDSTNCDTSQEGRIMSIIVFCEDTLLLQRLFYLFLRNTEHEVYLASDGIEGLRLTREKRPDIVLTDISMPLMDGFEMAKEIREDPQISHIPIIFVTGFAQRYDKEEAARYRPAAYLTKPCTSKYLKDKIDQVLREG